MTSGGRTNFTQYTHPQLYAMLYAGDPNTARTAAEGWQSTGDALHDQANALTRQLSGFQDKWQGGAADSYKTMVNDLIGGIQKVADTAYSMRNLAYDAVDAQDTARKQMPAPVDVPTVSPAVLALASSPIQVDASTPDSVVLQMQQARAQAVAAVQDQQQASAAASAAHAQAVAVMNTLAGNYVTTEEDIPPAPDAQSVPTIQKGPIRTTSNSSLATPINANLTATYTTGGGWSVSGDLTDPTTDSTTPPVDALTSAGATQPESPLFGNMFTAGVAAASAAVFGRFGSIIPKVPGFVNKDKDGNTDPATGKTGDPATTPKLGDRAAGAGLTGTGLKAGGLGGGGVGGGAAAPSVNSNLLGGLSPAAELGSGVAGAASAAGSATSSTPMMPMMPMSGMGGTDMGGGRRIPPWLMETEDVWNESSVVSPTVIGEDPDFGAW